MHQRSTTHLVHNFEKKRISTYDTDIYARGRVKKKKKTSGSGDRTVHFYIYLTVFLHLFKFPIYIEAY